jgi:serine palmitoyltransferase
MSKSPIHLPDFDKLSTMDLAQLQQQWAAYVETASTHFQKIPGSAILLRYIRSSYQNDPIRSVIELVLVIFFVRYLMAPSYSTHRQGFVQLSEEVGFCRY